MNNHRLPQPGERGLRWQLTPPGETVVLAPGCYVEGVGLTAASTRRIAAVAYGVGALDATGYADMLRAIDTADTDDGLDVLDPIQTELVATLNGAAIDGEWGFHEADLVYQPAGWWSE